MKKNPFYKNKNKKHNNMDSKEKEMPNEEPVMTPKVGNEEAVVKEAAPEEVKDGTDNEADEKTPPTEEEKLQEELETARQTIDEQKDKYLRLSAEFDNYRKRTMKEKAELILNGGEKTLNSVLPVIDDFERALKNMETATDVTAVKAGIELIFNKFVAVLKQNGVTPIDAAGQPLNTDYHEAIALVPTPDEQMKGKIIDCVQTGYMINDKVLRHAKVVVGQ
ncbi:MAG: nucleotide exchange factor GrpE [Prevotellaceae bacterium]|jgi:molecular chaperone GrpE|nr:nucleotide exchange factor GrpE [Prevotellaceae bacterium]